MKITITKIIRSDKSKDGKPFITKDGRPYTRIAIQTNEHGSKWLSGFEGFMTKNWAEGQEVEVDVEVKGDYLNFKVLSETGKIWKELNRQASEIVNLKKAVADFLNHNEPQQDEQDDFGKDGDLPF